ncbi:MAG: hypothetical protein M0Z85_05930 [Gammaproteobacteria bacterium]|nr:hypothetical protein [Gammaproteobacteria bacterium]
MDTKEKDHVLDAVPADRAPALAKALMKYGVTDGDPIAEIVKIAVDSDASRAAATAAASAAGEAAAQVKSAVQSIQSEISTGASKAGADVRAVIETAIAGTVKTSLDQAVQAGAAALRQAAADLPKIGRESQNQIVGEWRSALASAAREHALAGFFQRLSVNVAVLALLVGGIFVGGGIAGMAGMEYIATAQHRLVPKGFRLEVGQNGTPLCGPFAGRLVCLARHARHPNE